jgi:hypothetical protein
MGDPNKVLIEENDIRFNRLWYDMGLDPQSKAEDKDVFWGQINQRIALEKAKSLNYPNYNSKLEFYTDNLNLAEAQRARKEEKDTLLGYNKIYRPGMNELKTTQSPPPQRRQRPPSAVRMPPSQQQQHWGV